MKEILSDIIVVGGGMTGLLSALAVSETQKNIVLIDKNPLNKRSLKSQDQRTTAISEGSKNFLETINLWEKIKNKAENIKMIDVYNRNKLSKINFYNSDEKNLGYVVQNEIIKREILKILKNKKNIKLIQDEEINEITFNQDEIIAKTNKQQIKAKLVLAADGKKSSIRKMLKTKLFKKNYDHSALVLNFTHSKSINNVAYEIFYKDGPLAILPTKTNSKNTHRSSLIWSNKNAFASSLMKLKPKIRNSIIQEKIKSVVGSITHFSDTKIFNLSAHINEKFYDNRLVYVGDAAHSLHPIAGQGWNLGVKDIRNLLDILTRNKKLGLDLGSPSICKEYHDTCYYESFMLYQVTDKINEVFLQNNFLVNAIRYVGFNHIEKNSFLKNKISKYAMGFKIF